MALGQIDVSSMGFHRVVKIEATEPEQQLSTGSWVAYLEIYQEVPEYYLKPKKSERQKKKQTVTVHKMTFYFKEEPDWQAGVIYEVPTDE